jgi:hypothetical protein
MPCGASTSSLCVCQFRHLRTGATIEVYQRYDSHGRTCASESPRSLKQPLVPHDRFRIRMRDRRKLFMRRIQQHIRLASPGHQRRNHQRSAASLIQPAIPEILADLLTRIVPAGQIRSRNALHRNSLWDFDLNHAMRLRYAPDIRMRQHLENRAGVGLSRVEDSTAGRVPPSAIEPRPGCIKYGKTSIGNAKTPDRGQ